MAFPSVTYTFSNGSVADASEVNTNFTNIIDCLSDGTKDLSVNAGTFGGNVAMNANVDLGNATSDTITCTGTFDSDLIPNADSTYDLGSSSAKWAEIHGVACTLTGNLTVDTDTLFVDSTNDKVGINQSSPSSYYTTYNDLVVGNTSAGTSGIMIISTTSGVGSLSFGDGTALAEALSGRIYYDHSTNLMTFATAGNNSRMFIDLNGKVGIGTAPVTGKILTLATSGQDTQFDGATSTGGTSGFGYISINIGGGATRYIRAYNTP